MVYMHHKITSKVVILQILGVQMNSYQFEFFFLWYWGLNPGAFYLRATSVLLPRPYFLYFILKLGLTKLQRASLGRGERERERDRERETERERELRLAANPDPPVSASQSTGITSVRHHARP